MPTTVVLREGVDAIIAALIDEGFEVIGPTVSDDAVVYDQIESTHDLPQGWGDRQDGGLYRLVDRGEDALFGFNLGPTSWKQFLFPPSTELLRINHSNGEMAVEVPNGAAPRRAFFGVRSCELAAIAIQDEVFLNSAYVDRTYARLRADVFVVALNCGTAAATCFCTSMGTGPECTDGFDLVVTEVIDEASHRYVVTTGSEAGERVLASVGGRDAEVHDLEDVAAVVADAERQMGRQMETEGLRDLLVDNPDHPRWEEVAARCLTCGNCTLACPTCFCSNTVDTVTLDGEAIRSRVWDSCFSLQFSGLHRHPVRGSVKSRYRQWMTHKLATWHDQFGSSGCVGCGRCITWCPVGIDITEEVAAMRETLS